MSITNRIGLPATVAMPPNADHDDRGSRLSDFDAGNRDIR